ncbi:hypothetical protein DRJ12_01105 [Candidatus Acetothermia bacterium]|nr:MAG: hypothetical protein DRJ12_01105 [Candidatus Acetothermia bacterium]
MAIVCGRHLQWRAVITTRTSTIHFICWYLAHTAVLTYHLPPGIGKVAAREGKGCTHTGWSDVPWGLYWIAEVMDVG